MVTLAVTVYIQRTHLQQTGKLPYVWLLWDIVIIIYNLLVSNKLVPYDQKGVDGRSQWRTGTRETEVRLNGWCEGGIRQQRNDGGQ